MVSTEAMEHIKVWRQTVSNMKGVCSAEGQIVITTRSLGFRFYAFPRDYWRFEPSDMKAIFSDCRIDAIEQDWERPGVFLSASIPHDFRENDLSSIRMYSMVSKTRIASDEREGVGYRSRIAYSRLKDAGYSFLSWVFARLD